MINLDKIRADMFNEINSNYTYSGDKPDEQNIYANNCLDESIQWIKDNFSEFSPKVSMPVYGDSEPVKAQKRKNIKNIERKMKKDVYNNTPRPKPSGFIATITFGVLVMWVLQAIVGWVVSRILTNMYKNEVKESTQQNPTTPTRII